jgi:hypothetical protein
MKNNYKTLAVSAVLALIGTNASAQWFGSTPDDYERRAESERQRQEKYVENAINKSPEWMYKLPVSSNAIFAAGTGVSYDMAMADHKAKNDAYGKICMTAGGTASQSTKVFRTDTDKSNVDNTQIAQRSMCREVNLNGIEVREVKHIAEGGRFRSFVLLAFPTGDANQIKVGKEAQRQKEVALSAEDKAFRELDGEPQGGAVVTPVPAPQSLSPNEQIAPGKSDKVSVVTPNGSSQFQLLPVDNAEYRARREAALQKPGAVVGQVTINN